MMWGDRSPRAKLTGDSRRGFEAVLIGDSRSVRSLARNWPLRLLRLLQQYRSYAAIRGRHTLVRSCLKSRRLLAQSAAARCNVLCPSYVNPFHSLLPPTTRRSIVLIRSERSASAARISALVRSNVLT